MGRWRLALAATALFALTACGSNGGDDGDGVASLNGGDKKDNNQQAKDDGKSDQDKMREFAKCMREHGIDMPDPSADGGIMMHGTAVDANGPDGDKMQKADEACKHLLPNGGKPKPLSPEDLDKMRKQAKCMREHGIDMPDPDPNNPGMAISLGDGKDPAAIDKAFKECGMGDGVPAARAEAPVGGGGN